MTIPAKFLIGTDQGNVLCCNRKTRNPESNFESVYEAHFGAIYGLQRNPFVPKVNLVLLGFDRYKVLT